MKITKLSDSLMVADDVGSLWKQSSSGMPLSKAVSDLAKSMEGASIGWALCGGLAVGVHARPRGTQDVDIILAGEDSLFPFMSKVSDKFKKTRDHAMVHKTTGVEVELLTPEFLKVKSSIIQAAISRSSLSPVGGSSIPVVSREGLVALKLCRGSYQDMADIESILKGGMVDLTGYPLEEKELDLFKKLYNDDTGADNENQS